MKLSTVLLLSSLAASTLIIAACNQAQGSRSARLIGTHDLVLVSQNIELPSGVFLATKLLNEAGGFEPKPDGGMPSRFLFLTSADTNELRVLDNYPSAVGGGRSFAAAPNPLETLSIPVLDRPTMLATDEGRNAEGSRVTGNYVYAARPGGAEISVVSVTQKRQLNGRPFATPAPVTAIGAYIDVDRTKDVQSTPLPENTNLYVATWDGDFAAVFRATLPTNPGEVGEQLAFERKVLVDQSPITAMLVLPPFRNRTLDGAPFCDVKECIAISTRVNGGNGGQSYLLDPATGQQASLAFPGPVRKLVSSADSGRIYGVLDEQACGGPACGGIIAVEAVAGVASSFPLAKDATGAPMSPLRSGDGLITGLTVGAFHRNASGMVSSGTLQQTVENATADGGTGDRSFVLQEYTELGAFASSSGVITFFSGLAGSIIDFDARRATVTSANTRLPGTLPDGGTSFLGEDGGALGVTFALNLGRPESNAFEDTFRVVEVAGPLEGSSAWRVDISDGYLQSQNLAFIYQGQIPGLVSLPTSAADDLRVATGGSETRAAIGDIVRFETGNTTAGFVECGRSRVTNIGTGFIEVADMPAGCEQRVRFSVRADGAKKLVAVADIEGYLGRFAAGETLSYNRPYVLLPAGVVAQRTALTVNVPSDLRGLDVEGAAITFVINGFITPYQVSLDTLSLATQTAGGGCSNNVTTQVVVGNMVMDRVPTFSTANPLDFRWVLMGVVPSGNSTLEIALQGVRAGVLSGNDSVVCRR